MMWDWQGYGWWWWSLMWVGMVVFWGAIAWAVVALLRGRRGVDAEDVLMDRFARGEIDADEYRERLGVLRRGTPRRAA